MVCRIQITDVTGRVFPGETQPYAIDVKGTAEGCPQVFVESNCLKPSSATAVVDYPDGPSQPGGWAATIFYQPGGARCECGSPIAVTAQCTEDPANCERGVFSGVLSCERSEERCPKDIYLRVFDENNYDVTQNLNHNLCQLPGVYRFKVEVLPGLQPGWSVSLTIRIEENGVEQIVDPATDPRIQILSADNTEFTVTLASDIIVEVIATVITGGYPDDGCALLSDSATLTGCEEVCPEPGQYNPVSGECCPPGQYYDPATRRCEPRCPPGQHYNPQTGRCEDDVPTCPPGQHYNPQTGRCEDDEPGDGGKSCGIACILAGIFLIAIPISAHISLSAFCVGDWVQAAQVAAIAAAIAWYIRFCGICCLYPFIYLGVALGIIAILIASIWLGFPQCLLLGVILMIGYVAAAAGFQAACNARR